MATLTDKMREFKEKSRESAKRVEAIANDLKNDNWLKEIETTINSWGMKLEERQKEAVDNSVEVKSKQEIEREIEKADLGKKINDLTPLEVAERTKMFSQAHSRKLKEILETEYKGKELTDIDIKIIEKKISMYLQSLILEKTKTGLTDEEKAKYKIGLLYSDGATTQYTITKLLEISLLQNEKDQEKFYCPKETEELFAEKNEKITMILTWGLLFVPLLVAKGLDALSRKLRK